MQGRIAVSTGRVRALLAAQFPQLADQALRPVAAQGWDNHSFRLGADMAVRLPAAPEYAPQVEREMRWLGKLAACLPLELPVPLHMGQPGQGYPLPWSIRRWVAGTPLQSCAEITDPQLARDIARFLKSLQNADVAGGPPPGAANFYRGGELTVYDGETRTALGQLDMPQLVPLWEQALSEPRRLEPVWVHGDIAPGNLILRDGRLAGVIDFGLMAVGDPACDLAIAWSHMDSACREAFAAEMGASPALWNHARGWALWKAAIVLAGEPAPAAQASIAERVLALMLQDSSSPQNRS